MRITCHECQAHLVAYINDEVKPRRRRAVAQHLDECGACYAAYREQRGLVSDLQLDLKRIGQPSTPQLDTMWAAIQANMRHARPIRRRFRRRYGLAVVLILLTLLRPWSLSTPQFAFALSLAPVPEPNVDGSATPESPVNAAAEARPTRVLARAGDPLLQPAETPAAPAAVFVLATP